MFKKINLMILFLLSSFLAFDFVFADNDFTSVKEDFNYQQQIENIRVRQDELADRVFMNNDRILQYSKDTINYFLIVLSLLASFAIIFGWKTIKNAKKDLENKINKIAKDKINLVAEKMSTKIGEIDDGLKREAQISALWQNYMYKKSYEDKLRIIDEIIAKNPRDNKAYGTKGILLSSFDKCEEALEYFDKAIALKDDDEVAHFNKVVCLEKLNRNDDAIIAIDKAIAIRSNVSEFYNKKSDNLIKMKRYDEALKNIDKAIEINSNEYSYFNTKAEIYLEMENYFEAINYYKKARALEGSSRGQCNFNSYQINISYSYYRLRDFEKAYTEASIGLSIGYSVELAVNKGLAAAGLGKNQEAIDLINSALAIEWRKDEVLYCQAKIYGLLGLKDKCFSTLRHVIEIDKKYIDMAKNEQDFSSVSSATEFLEIINLR